MTLVIGPEPLDCAAVLLLLAASDAFSAAHYPPESNHTVGLDVLSRPEVTFLVARLDGRAAGALALYRRAGYAERGPFGSYRLDPLSVFMHKRLARPA